MKNFSKIWENQIFKIATLSFIVAFLVFSNYIITNGGTLYMNGDGFQQQLAFYLDGWDQFHSNGIFSWSWKHFYGNDYMSATTFYTGFSPYFNFVMIFPKQILPQVMLFTNMLKFTVSATLLAVFLKKIGVKSTVSLALGGLIYAGSGAFVINFYFQHFADFFSLFPLLLIGIELLIDRKWYWLPLIVAGLALVNPYFVVSLSIITFFYVCARVITIETINYKEKIFLVIQYVLLFTLGLVMVAAIFLPSIIKFMKAGRSGSNLDFIQGQLSNPMTILYNFLQVVIATIFPPSLIKTTELVQDNGVVRNGIATYAWQSLAFYTSAISLLLFTQATTFFKRKKVFVWVVFVFIMLLITCVPLLNSAVNGLGNVTFRFGYIFTALIAVLTALIVENINKIKIWKFNFTATFIVFLTIFIPFIVYLVSLNSSKHNKITFFEVKNNQNPDFMMFIFKNLVPSFIMLLVIISIVNIMYFKMQRTKRNSDSQKKRRNSGEDIKNEYSWLLYLVSSFHVIIMFNVFIQFGWGPYIDSVASGEKVSQTVEKNIEFSEIKRKHSFMESERVAIDRSVYGEEDWWQNQGLAYNLNSPTTYQSLYNRATNDYYNWQYLTSGEYDTWVRGYRPTRQSMNMLNINYYISKNEHSVPESFALIDQTNSGDIYRSTTKSSLIKQYKYYITPEEIEKVPLLFRNEYFSNALIVDENIAQEQGLIHYDRAYESVKLSTDDPMINNGESFTYTLPVNESGELVFIKSESVNVSVKNKTTKEERLINTTSECAYNLGNICRYYVLSISKDEIIQVEAPSSDPKEVTFDYYFNSDNTLSEQFSKVNMPDVKEYTKGSYYSAEIENNIDENGMYFLSIPNDSGWTAYVDGSEVPKYTVDGGFIGISVKDLKVGSHKLELKFVSEGFVQGVQLTILGGFTYIALVFLSKSVYKNNNHKK